MRRTRTWRRSTGLRRGRTVARPRRQRRGGPDRDPEEKKKDEAAPPCAPHPMPPEGVGFADTLSGTLNVASRPGRWTMEAIYELFPKLAERRRNLGNPLSGGEQQMLAIGRALIGNPSLILMDEPFEGLAPVIIDQLTAVLKSLRDAGEPAVLLVEQYTRLALDLTDRALVLDRGRVVYDGGSRALLDDTSRFDTLIGIAEPPRPNL